MKDYLYILPFSNGDYFKIGISSENYNRILTHHQSFKIDLNRITIVIGTKNDIRTIERILLSLFKGVKNNPHQGKDGASEIRYNKDLEQCMNDIKYWSERINLTIKHPTKKEIIPKVKKGAKRLTNEEKLIRQQKQNVLDEEMNKENFVLLSSSLKDILSKYYPNFICKTNKIEGFYSYPNNSYTFCWSGENIPNSFLKERFNYHDEKLSFTFHTKPESGMLGGGMHNLGCLSVSWVEKNRKNNETLEGVYCFLDFNLLSDRCLSRYGVNDEMLISYSRFENDFKQLIKPYVKNNSIWKPSLVF